MTLPSPGSPRTRPRMLATALATALALTGLLSPLATTPTASAAPQQSRDKAYVAFGDSYAAGTHVNWKNSRRATGCSVGRDSYPELIAGARFGGDIGNASCDAATSDVPPPYASLYSEIASASARGWLGPRTTLVTITIGGNEPWLFLPAPGWTTGVVTGGLGVTRENFVLRHRVAVQTIKRLAPHARILFVGYPTVVENGSSCLVNLDLSDSRTVNVPLPSNLGRYLDATTVAAQRSSRELGFEVVDTRRPGTGSCAPVDRRWVSSWIDTRGTRDVWAFHPTRLGHRRIADLVLARLGETPRS